MLTTRFGLSVHQHKGAWPDKDAQKRLGIHVLRVLVVDQDLLLHQLANDLADDVKVIALINPQTPGVNPAGTPDGLDGWTDAITDFAHRFAGKIDAVECLNEWDIGPKNTIDQVAQCAIDASPIVRAAGMKCLLGSVGGATWLQELKKAVRRVEQLGQRAALDGVCTHPYLRPAHGVPDPQPDGAWGPPELHEAVKIAFNAVNASGTTPQLPVYVTEYGLPIDKTDDGEVQAQFVMNSRRTLGDLPPSVLGAAAYFAYSDRSHDDNGTVFGLVRQDLTERMGAVALAGGPLPSGIA